MPFYNTEECAAFIKDYLTTNKSSLTPVGGDEVQAIYDAEQRIIPKFPSIMVVPGPISRILVATGMQAQITFTVFLYVMHAKLTKTKTVRSKEDLQMSSLITDKLHENKNLDGNVVFGYVSAEDPGSLAGPQGLAVVGTRLTWTGEQRRVIF